MSACFVGMALALNGNGKLYAIDPHSSTEWNDMGSVNSYEIMAKNVRSLGLSRYVEIVRKTSAEAAQGWNRKIDLLFIDGDHSYEGIKSDWELSQRTSLRSARSFSTTLPGTLTPKGGRAYAVKTWACRGSSTDYGRPATP